MIHADRKFSDLYHDVRESDRRCHANQLSESFRKPHFIVYIQTVFMNADDSCNYFMLAELRFISVGFTFTKPVTIAMVSILS